jgi:hypothetical protein
MVLLLGLLVCGVYVTAVVLFVVVVSSVSVASLFDVAVNAATVKFWRSLTVVHALISSANGVIIGEVAMALS